MASLNGVQKYISHWPFLKQRICELLVSAVSLLLTAGLVSESGRGSRKMNLAEPVGHEDKAFELRVEL